VACRLLLSARMHLTTGLVLALGLAACGGPARQAPSPPAPPPPSTTVVIHDTAPAEGSVAVHKVQPASTKLKLGHYRNDRLGVGAVIDRTTVLDNEAKIPPAKLRFDGESKVWTLEGRHGGDGRIDYVDGGRIMLHVWDDGRVALYVRDPDTDRASEQIDVYRDGDADPL